MKALVIAVAALTLLVSPALGFQCPLLIKQLNDAVGKMKADDAKTKEAKAMIAEVQKLHDAGKHADAVKKAQETAKVLGITLKMKKT